MNLETLTEQISTLLRKPDLTAVKEAASLVIDARSGFFLTPSGHPDYAGRSYAYRQWYGDIIRSLNMEEKDRAKLQSRMRFHMANIIRDRLNDEELKDAGLMKIKPVERGHHNYAQRSKIYKMVTETDPLDDPLDRELAMSLIQHLQDRLN